MTALLEAFLPIVQESFVAGVALFLRIAAAFAVLPAFGERAVPMRVRIVLALAFTAIVAPATLPMLRDTLPATGFPALLFGTETIVGLALGLTLRMFIFVLQIAGEIAAQSASLAQIFGGSATVDAQPAFANLMLFAGLAFATLMGLHVKIAALFIYSYEIFPVGRFLPALDAAPWGIAQISRGFSLAFSLAAPFVIASLVYNLALGVINRAMPQLMVAFVGAPAISGGGLVILFLVMPLILATWLAAFDAVLADPIGAFR